MNSDWLNFIFGTVVAGILINIASHFVSKRLEVWNANRSFVSARNSIEKLTNDLNMIRDFAGGKQSLHFYLLHQLFRVLSMFLAGVYAFAFSAYLAFQLFAYSPDHYIHNIAKYGSWGLFMAGILFIGVAGNRVNKVLTNINRYMNIPRFEAETMKRIDYLKQKHRIEVQ